MSNIRDDSDVFGIFYIDNSKVASAAKEILGTAFVGRGHNPIGDLNKRFRKMSRLSPIGGKTVGKVLARAAQIEKEVNTDEVSDVSGECNEFHVPRLFSFGPDEYRINLIENLDGGGGNHHHNKIAIHDVSHFVRHNGFLLVLIKEMENSF